MFQSEDRAEARSGVKPGHGAKSGAEKAEVAHERTWLLINP